VLATGLKFSDALASSPLAGKLDAPILLTSRAGLSTYATSELKRMYAGHDGAVLYAVGSGYSMPAAVIAQAGSAIGSVLATGSVRVVRIEAADDFTLARRVAEQVGAPKTGPFADTAIIASYSAYADALSVSPLAAKHGIPILFVTATGIPLATQQALVENGIKHCLIVGGPGTVSPGVEAWLESRGHRVSGVADNTLTSPDTRLSGATRYDVSVNALKYGALFGGMDTSEVFVASGLVWPDALAAGPLGGKRSHPVLLVQGRDINFSPPAGTWLVSRRYDPPRVTFFGGLGTISDYARGQVGRCLGLN
jgi:putative cell wall-binding protein